MEIKKIFINHLKPQKAFFNWCESHFPIYEFKRKGTVTRSSNSDNLNRKIIQRNIRVNSNLGLLFEAKQFVIYMATKKRIEVQSWVYYQTINNDLSETLEFRLANIEHMSNDKYIKGSYRGDNHYGDSLDPWTFQSGPYTSAYYYPQDYDVVFKFSELRHFDVKRFTCNPYAYQNLMRLYRYRLGLEYIQKMGGKKLFNSIVEGRADMRVVTKKFIRSNKGHIKKDMSFDEIHAVHLIRNMTIEPNYNSLEYITPDMKLLKQYVKLPNFRRLQNYLVRQESSLTYYDDYVQLLGELNVPINSDLLRFPKDLKLAHDERLEVLSMVMAENISKQKKELEIKAKIVSRKIHGLEMDLGKYAVVAPSSLEDIVNEGSILNHCVGMTAYLEQHTAGKSVVLFLREKGKENTPFHTFSFDMKNRVTQVQGYGNKQTPLRNEIEKLINAQWLPFAINQLERLGVNQDGRY